MGIKMWPDCCWALVPTTDRGAMITRGGDVLTPTPKKKHTKTPWMNSWPNKHPQKKTPETHESSAEGRRGAHWAQGPARLVGRWPRAEPLGDGDPLGGFWNVSGHKGCLLVLGKEKEWNMVKLKDGKMSWIYNRCWYLILYDVSGLMWFSAPKPSLLSVLRWRQAVTRVNHRMLQAAQRNDEEEVAKCLKAPWQTPVLLKLSSGFSEVVWRILQIIGMNQCSWNLFQHLIAIPRIT